MEFSSQVKPVTYIKTHTAEAIREITATGNPLIVTQNGEAKVIMLDIREYDKIKASLAMLKMLAVSSKEVEEGKTFDADEVFDELEAELDAKKHEK